MLDGGKWTKSERITYISAAVSIPHYQFQGTFELVTNDATRSKKVGGKWHHLNFSFYQFLWKALTESDWSDGLVRCIEILTSTWLDLDPIERRRTTTPSSATKSENNFGLLSIRRSRNTPIALWLIPGSKYEPKIRSNWMNISCKRLCVPSSASHLYVVASFRETDSDRSLR